jgi:hypothetical protein
MANTLTTADSTPEKAAPFPLTRKRFVIFEALIVAGALLIVLLFGATGDGGFPTLNASLRHLLGVTGLLHIYVVLLSLADVLWRKKKSRLLQVLVPASLLAALITTVPFAFGEPLRSDALLFFIRFTLILAGLKWLFLAMAFSPSRRDDNVTKTAAVSE